VRSIVITPFVCVSVCLSVCPHVYLQIHVSELFIMHVLCGRGSVLLWRHCDMLCTSGFVDDVMFAHNGPSIAYSNTVYEVFLKHVHCCPASLLLGEFVELQARRAGEACSLSARARCG